MDRRIEHGGPSSGPLKTNHRVPLGRRSALLQRERERMRERDLVERARGREREREGGRDRERG